MNKTERSAAIKAAKKGDKKAFEQLYGDHRDKLYFFALKNVGSKAAAEDIVSETFLDAMQNIGSLKADEAFGSWLYSIAYRKCIRHNEENSRTAHFESEEEQELAISDYGLNEPIELPEDYAVNRQRQQQLRSVIDSLSPEQRSAVILFYYNEQTLSQVADTLGISKSAAGKRLFDARKKIKAGVEKLKQSGAFCAAPLGAVLESAIDSSYAAGAVKTGAAVKGVSAIKIAAVSAAAVVAVGVPVGLHTANIGWGGDNSQADSSITQSEDNTPASAAVRVFPDDLLDQLKLSMTFRDFDETWYTIEGDGLAGVKEMLSKIEGEPCEDPQLSGWYMFDINMAEEVSMIHRLDMSGNYICLDGTMYKNEEPDNGRELAEYFRAHGQVSAEEGDPTNTSESITEEFELVQYNEKAHSGYAASEKYGLASFGVPEEYVQAFESSGVHPGHIIKITWSGSVLESYPSILEDVTAVTLEGEREDFIAKYLDPVVISCLTAGDNADIYAAVDSIEGLNRQEKDGLGWVAENKFYNIREGDIPIRDYCLELLAALDYQYGTNDGLPEYTLSTDDGDFYQINLSSGTKWVWHGSDYEAVIPEDMAELLEMYKDDIGLQPVNWN